MSQIDHIGHFIGGFGQADVDLAGGALQIPNDLVHSPLALNEHNSSETIQEKDSLIYDMRAALSEKLELDSNSSGVNGEHLRVYTEQVDSKMKEIALNASILFEELELYSSSQTSSSFSEIDPMAMLADFNHSNWSISTNYNGSMINGEQSWLQDIQDEVSIIESWEVEAEKLSKIAIVAFQQLKDDTTNIMETSRQEAIATIETNADGLYREMQMRQNQHVHSQKEKHIHSTNPILFDEETWQSGGFQFEDAIPPENALEAIVAMPMKTYKLKDDKKRDLGVSKDERRTRHHVGVIEPGEGDKQVEPASIFSYNLGAISQLASSLERLATVSSSFFQIQSNLGDKVSFLNIETEIQQQASFKSPSQLASEVAALDTEAALTRIALLSQTVLQSTRVNLISSRLMSKVKSLVERDAMSARENRVEQDSMSSRENYAECAEAYLDRILIHFEAVDKIKTLRESASRELVEMNEAAKIESLVAKEEIYAEAEAERENEAASLDLIKLLGKARMEEIIHAIESIFWHLAGSLQHLFTPEGREQFLFYAGTLASLVFMISTMKEMITLGCICVLRYFTAPRLVREYGNLSAKAIRSSKRAQAMKEIVLPPQSMQRMELVVKVAESASKKRLPLRSVLIHGKPGAGKSIAAKAIAKSCSLPYALMSGADVFPMGSQGPAELRRLLTWASNKRHGGILIIDEAECALGSRVTSRTDDEGAGRIMGNDTTPSSACFSRDCLNVLLSMTGSFGNIMMILTTSNPSELDDAVLDRIDEIIHLPLPSENERELLLRSQFSRQFELEEDCNATYRLLSNIRRSNNAKAHFDAHFDVECVLDLAKDSKTEGFSGRELEKIIQGILHKTYASDSGVLSTSLWEMETKKLVKAVAVKKRGTGSRKQRGRV